MGNKDSLGDRMKRYESIPKLFLTRRIAVIIRIDGRAFHTFTRGFRKPFDNILMRSMQDTMKCLCENVQGCVFGYTQSDEITLVLTDYATLKTDAWFGYSVQKVVSVAASIATSAFNRSFYVHACNWIDNFMETWNTSEADEEYARILEAAMCKGATFDARAFSIPKEEVCNCLIWRQQDATRNSIQSVGQANFSQKQLQGRNCNDIQTMLIEKRGINWGLFQTDCKRGSCCIRKQDGIRNPWIIDKEPPIFTQEREYIERFL